MSTLSGSHAIPLALGATAAAAATAAVVGLYAASSASDSLDNGSYHIIVFLDTAGCSRNGKLIIHSKQAPLSALESAVCSALQIQQATLFLWDTKECLTEVYQQQLDQHLINCSSWRTTQVIPIIACEAGKLSADAAQLSPIKPPPCGPRPLPVVCNALLAKGPYDPPLYNFWHHLFTPDKLEKWGETVAYVMPATPDDAKEAASHCDEAAAFHTTIQTCDPDIVGELLERQEDFPKFWNRAVERGLTRLGSNGIFTSSTPSTDWQTVHGLFPRGFNQIKITQAYFPIILRKTHNFVAEWARLPQGQLLTGVNNWLACMTADAVIKATCNVDMDNIARRARGEAAHPILDTFRQVGKISPATAKPWQVVGLWNYLNPLYDTKAGQQQKFMVLRNQLKDLVDDLIEKTRTGELGDTLLSSLINDRSPTNGQYVRQSLLFGHFVNLLVAGHETTANTMGFMMYYLSQNPEWEQRVRQEIRDALGGRSELCASDIPQLVVAEACFREALRLHPPAAQISRDALHDTVIKGQYLVRRGQRVQINLVALHRNPKHWGGAFGDPNSFNPARFLPGAAEACGRHPHAYKPFGFGVRACAGMQFALWEAKTLIPMLYHNFTFKLVENFKLRPSRKESFPSPSAEGLAFYIYPAPGAPAPPALPRSISTTGSSDTAAAADAAAAPDTPNNGTAKQRMDVHNTPLLVLYGSNGGTCEAFAAQVVESAAAAGFKAAAATLDSLVAGGKELPNSGAVLVVTSTYNGLPPDNAVRFAKWPAAAGAAAGVPYAVLGVGNSQWVTYQSFPRQVDAGLAAAGGVQLCSLTEADTETPGFTDAATEWWAHLKPLLLQHFKVAAPEGTALEAPTVPRLQLAEAPEGTQALFIRDVLHKLKAHAVATAGATLADKSSNNSSSTDAHDAFGYGLLKVVGSTELQAAGTGRFTKHVELELPDNMTYAPGDHLEVLPKNAPALVDSALQLLGMSGDEVLLWTPGAQAIARGLNSSSSSSSNAPPAAAAAAWFEMEPLPMSSRNVLEWLVDLSAVPSRKVLAGLAEACPCPPEAARLRQLASEAVYKEQVSGMQLTLLEVLSQHRSLLPGLDLTGLAGLLPRLAPRYYSISSSPSAPGGPRRASITVGLVEFTTPTGREHNGAASTTIHRQQVGLYLAGMVRQLQSRFRLPQDPTTPIIMVGPGTGVAPMIGFLEERETQQKAGVGLGPAVLFFGCRNSRQDFLYRQQLESWHASGVLSDLKVAFSREPGQPKVYVQDLIKAAGPQLWQLLQQQGARVYVCGDARAMAPDVRATFMGIAQAVGILSQPDSQAWLQDMRESGRYLEDVWAS